MRRAASRAHAALLPKLQSGERTGQKGVDPGNGRKERPLRVGCPDPRGTSLEWEAAPAALNRLKCCERPPVLPGLRPDTEWTPPPESQHPAPPRHPASGILHRRRYPATSRSSSVPRLPRRSGSEWTVSFQKGQRWKPPTMQPTE
ncbi:uncharacterized protein LOC143268132 isoform X2 [Peromyscus maniculatus bairdii]|uniref:uncharacterized protein LOC143268132 isoform X2 n=1 Tax=Peromyscus maniculatus bairdii TaxID=230844 RepID=UPI003FD32726